MPAKSYHLVSDGMLEAQHYAHCYDHNGQTYSHTSSGNDDGGFAHLSLVVIIAVDMSCYEEWQVHMVSPSTLPGYASRAFLSTTNALVRSSFLSTYAILT